MHCGGVSDITHAEVTCYIFAKYCMLSKMCYNAARASEKTPTDCINSLYWANKSMKE